MTASIPCRDYGANAEIATWGTTGEPEAWAAFFNLTLAGESFAS